MKSKIMSFLMALLTMFSCTTTAFAASAATPDMVTTQHITDDPGIMPLSDLSFSFNGLAKGSYAYSSEIYNIKNENSALHILSATWSLASNAVWIGYYNIDTKKDYGVRYEDGSIYKKTINSKGLPNGSYRIIVKNLGPGSISGSIKYYVD